MLSDSNIRQINRQIENELDSLWNLDHQDTMEALQRIAELKKILEPTFTVEQIVETLDQPTLSSELSRDLKKIFDTFRR